MMNQERSAFEHCGIPLKNSQNTGRMRHMQSPWQQTFTARPTQAVVESKLGEMSTAMPESFVAVQEEHNSPEVREPARDAVGGSGARQIALAAGGLQHEKKDDQSTPSNETDVR